MLTQRNYDLMEAIMVTVNHNIKQRTTEKEINMFMHFSFISDHNFGCYVNMDIIHLIIVKLLYLLDLTV